MSLSDYQPSLFHVMFFHAYVRLTGEETGCSLWEALRSAACRAQMDARDLGMSAVAVALQKEAALFHTAWCSVKENSGVPDEVGEHVGRSLR